MMARYVDCWQGFSSGVSVTSRRRQSGDDSASQSRRLFRKRVSPRFSRSQTEPINADGSVTSIALSLLSARAITHHVVLTVLLSTITTPPSPHLHYMQHSRHPSARPLRIHQTHLVLSDERVHESFETGIVFE